MSSLNSLSSSLRLQSRGNGGQVLATRTPNRTRQTVGRLSLEKTDKFAFDAPQFQDFTHPRYRTIKRRLEEVVLPEEEREEWQVEELSAEAFDSPNKDDYEWFQTRHLEHEPSSPPTPTGPLITPDNSPLSRTWETPKRTHSIPSNSPLSPLFSSAGRRTTPLRSLGLRSKPMRVIANPSDSGASSAEGSDASLRFSQSSNISLIKTPTINRSRRVTPRNPKKWQIASLIVDHDDVTGTIDSARRSSSIERAKELPTSPIQSLIERENKLGTSPLTFGDTNHWSSIPETPPMLNSALIFDNEGGALDHFDDKGLFHEDDGPVLAIGKRSMPEETPVASKDEHPKANAEIRRIGLTSKALRVERAPEEFEEYKPPPHILRRPPLSAKSPVIKRLKMDAKFCPAPPVIPKVNHPFVSPINILVQECLP